jgi:iron complex transport system ATP-binding protein
MKKTYLEIKDLEIGYKLPLTNKINLFANNGDLICLIGRNGTGKSTLLNTIAGILKPIKGEIFIDSTNVCNIKSNYRSSIISFVPSKQEYLSNLRLIDLIEMGRSPYTNIFDKKNQQDKEIIESAINEFQLKHIIHKHLYEVSDGERQRAMICRAFVQETAIILLDEPTAFLDYYARQKLLQSLKDIASKKNKCIIFSTHDLELAFKYTNKIWLFNNNNINEYNLDSLKQSDLLEKTLCFKF